jgi:hypothetical protein
MCAWVSSLNNPADLPMPLPRPMSKAAIEAEQILAPDSATKRDIINRFTNVLYDLTRPGACREDRARAGCARWTLAPRDAELF